MTLVIQNSPEWFSLRLGQVTASRVADIIARTKTGYSTSRANYLAQLVSERLTGTVSEGFTNGPMQWGIDHESEARAAYSFRFDRTVDAASFIAHPRIEMSGASPDGLVGVDGLIEIKCPNTATHIDTLLSGMIPLKYETQMLWQMACTGRAWRDFASYDPRLPEAMALFTKRLQRSDERTAELESEVSAFLREVDDVVDRLDSGFGLHAKAAAERLAAGGADIAPSAQRLGSGSTVPRNRLGQS